MAHRFKELEIWKRSRQLCTVVYRLTSNFPEAEKFGLISQLRRATVSIPSNITEGSSRKSNKDFSRFLEIALGSLYELETQLIIAHDLDFILRNDIKPLQMEIDEIAKMISKFKSTLK